MKETREADVTKDGLRVMVNDSISYINRGGVRWRDNQACHQITFTVWSLNRALQTDCTIEKPTVGRWNAWSTTWKNIFQPITIRKSFGKIHLTAKTTLSHGCCSGDNVSGPGLRIRTESLSFADPVCVCRRKNVRGTQAGSCRVVVAARSYHPNG